MLGEANGYRRTHRLERIERRDRERLRRRLTAVYGVAPRASRPIAPPRRAIPPASQCRGVHVRLRPIVDRDLANQDLSAETVAKSVAVLYEVAYEEFGSWETAVEYAGVRTRGSLPGDQP